MTHDPRLIIHSHWQVFVKQSRWRMFKELVLTFSGLIVKDTVAQGLALRHQKDTNRAVASLAEFRRWAIQDTHAASRSQFRRREKLVRTQRQLTNAVYRGIKEIPPVAISEIGLESLEVEPEGMIGHHDSVRGEAHFRFPQPINGIQWFRKQAAKNKVVLRFVDARNCNIGLVLADFTKCDWGGVYIYMYIYVRM